MAITADVFVAIGEIWEAALQDRTLAPLVNRKWPKPMTVTWPSKAFDRIVAISDGTAGIRVKPLFQLDSEALRHVRWFHIDCRQLCQTSDADREWYLQEFERLPWAKGAQGIKYFENFKITKVERRPTTIVSPDGPPAHFLPDKVSQAFRDARLTGFELGPVLSHDDNKRHEGVSLLVVRHFLPPLFHNPSVVVYNDDGNTKTSARGFFSYTAEALTGAPDFCRTREATDGFNVAKVVVSRRVYDVYAARNFRGLHFHPVLQVGTEPYELFLNAWGQFTRQIGINPLNRFQ